MKRQILFVIICLCLLAACGEKEQVVEKAQTQEPAISECAAEVEKMQESSVSKAEEETDIEVDDSAVLRTISMDEVLLMCKRLEDEVKSSTDYSIGIRNISNESFCVVLRNGEVYCANLYANSIPDREECAFLTEEMLPYLQDIRYIGKVSDDEFEMIRGNVDQADLNISTYAKWTGCSSNFPKIAYNQIEIIDGYLAIYRDGEKAAIWRHDQPIGMGESVNMKYLDNGFSTKIIYWFLESTFYQEWGEYTLNTGTNKNPILDSTYVTSLPVSMKDVYPDIDIFRISSEEELEYTELNMGISKEVFIALYGDDFWQGMQQIVEDYPLEEFDYILKISTWDNWRATPNPNWRQRASSLRHNDDYIYFRYDTYNIIKYTDPAEDEKWIAGMEAPERWGYVDIAVVAKDSMEKAGLSEIPTPQEIGLHPIEETESEAIP